MPWIRREKLERLKSAEQVASDARQRANAYEQEISKAFSRIREEVPEAGNAVTPHTSPSFCWGFGWDEGRLSSFIVQWLDEYKRAVAANRSVCVVASSGSVTEHRPASHWEVDESSPRITVYLGRRVIAQHAEYDAIYFKEEGK